MDSKRKQRADIKPLDKDPMADMWMASGKCNRLFYQSIKFKMLVISEFLFYQVSNWKRKKRKCRNNFSVVIYYAI